MKAGLIGQSPVSFFLASATFEVFQNTTLDFALTTIFHSDAVKAQTATLRSLEYGTDAYKNYKKYNMFAVTISSMCGERRRKDHVDKRNPLICIDVDLKENPKLEDESYRKYFMDTMFASPYVYAVGTSSSGKGIYIIVYIGSNVDDDDFTAAFLSLEDRFKRGGIEIDKNCKDINRLRIVCSDPVMIKPADADISPYTFRLEVEKPEIHFRPIQSMICGRTKHDVFLAVMDRLISSGFTTDSYNEWCNVAFALHGVPEGLELFERISSQSCDYKGHGEVVKKWHETDNSRFTTDGTYAYFFKAAREKFGANYFSEALNTLNKANSRKYTNVTN